MGDKVSIALVSTILSFRFSYHSMDNTSRGIKLYTANGRNKLYTANGRNKERYTDFNRPDHNRKG